MIMINIILIKNVCLVVYVPRAALLPDIGAVVRYTVTDRVRSPLLKMTILRVVFSIAMYASPSKDMEGTKHKYIHTKKQC